MNLTPSTSAFAVSREDPSSQIQDAFRRLRMRPLGSHLISWGFPPAAEGEGKANLTFSIAMEQAASDRVIVQASYALKDSQHQPLELKIALTCEGNIEMPSLGSAMTSHLATQALTRIQEYLPFVYNGVSV
jgi:hypothetical protein